MNRFQESLDYLKKLQFDENEYVSKKADECLDTLQELINNMKFIEEVQTPDYIRVQNLNEKLELALDITLSKLADCKICHQASIDHAPDCKDYKSCKECWKECLLKESEEQNV